MRVTLRPPSDCTLLDSMVGLEEKLVYGHVTGNPQEQEERGGNDSQTSHLEGIHMDLHR